MYPIVVYWRIARAGRSSLCFAVGIFCRYLMSQNCLCGLKQVICSCDVIGLFSGVVRYGFHTANNVFPERGGVYRLHYRIRMFFSE